MASLALLDPAEVDELLVAAGVPTVAQRICTDAEQAVRAAEEVGFPVALKLLSTAVVHKSDVGGVLLGLDSADEVRRGYEQLRAIAARLGTPAEPWAALVQEMAASTEVELLVGVKRDPAFGPVVLVGAGGRLAELVGDVAVRRCPVDAETARAMVAETRVSALVDGYRGGRALGLEQLASVIAAVSRIPARHPEVEELEVNPLVPAAGEGWRALDARVLVSSAPSRTPAAPPDERRAAERASQVAAILEAHSIVLIGASASDPRKPGSRVLAYLLRHGYPGDLYVVHPTASELAGLRCYPTIEALPERPLDLACIAIPAGACADALERCGRRGVRAAVVLTAGFAEVGNVDGEEALGRIADSYSLGLCGPNTVGAISPASRLHACFSQAQEARPLAGGIALVTQSGALGGSLLSQAWERGLGVSRFVTVGNQARLGFADYLHYLADDPETRVACLLLEGVEDGTALAGALERMAERGKPVVVVKAGRSKAGGAAVRSHTGALAGDERVYEAIFRETGAISVATLTELLDAALALERQPLPLGRRVGVASTSGGACSLVADLCATHGLEVPELPAAERTALAGVLPPFAAAGNPVDVSAQVTSDSSLFGKALRIMLGAEGLDAVVIVLTTLADPQATEVAEDIAASVRDVGKPVVVAWTIARGLAPDGIAILERSGIPVYPALERAVAAVAALARCADHRARTLDPTALRVNMLT